MLAETTETINYFEVEAEKKGHKVLEKVACACLWNLLFRILDYRQGLIYFVILTVDCFSPTCAF